MVFLNLVVFASWPLTAILNHSTLPSPHYIVVAPQLNMVMVTATPRRKQTAEPTNNLVSSAARNFDKSVSCLNAVESFSARIVLRSSARRFSLAKTSDLDFCTLVYS